MGKTRNCKTRLITEIAMLGAIAGVLMLFEFPLPFLAPSFYQIDFSEVPVLIGGLYLGPIGAVVIEAVKILVHLVIKGSSTAGIGDFANFCMGCAFVIPFSLIARSSVGKNRAIVATVGGTLSATIIACFLNIFVLLPIYGKAFGIPIDGFFNMGAAIIPLVNGPLTFALLIIVPFNFIKYILTSVVGILLYNRVKVILWKTSC